MSSKDQAKTSLYCRNKFTNYALLCEGISLAISTIFCSPFSHAWLRSSSVEVFTLWDTFNSRSIASCWYWNSFKDLGSSCWGCSYVTSIFSLLMNGVLIYTTSISNNGIIFGFSARYCSISLSSKPSIIFIYSTYNGTNSFLVNIFSRVETRSLVLPLRNEMIFFCQICFILAVYNHGQRI